MPDSTPPAPPATAVGAFARRAGPAVKREAAGRRGDEGDRRRCEDAARARLPGVRGRRSAPRNRLSFRRNPLISQDRRKYKFPQISAWEAVPPSRAPERARRGEAASTAGAVRVAGRRPSCAAAERRESNGDRRRCEDAAQVRPQSVRGRRSAGPARLQFCRNPLISRDRQKYEFWRIFRAEGVSRGGAQASATGEALWMACTSPRLGESPDTRPRLMEAES